MKQNFKKVKRGGKTKNKKEEEQEKEGKKILIEQVPKVVVFFKKGKKYTGRQVRSVLSRIQIFLCLRVSV